MRWSESLKLGVLVLLLSVQLPLGATEAMHHEAKKPDIQGHMAWVRAVPPVSTNTAAYMKLHNSGDKEDRLIGAESPVAEVVELHLSEMNDGRMKMMKVDGIALPAGGHVMLEPAGYHIMLINLKQPIKVGDSVPLTLILEQHGRIDMTVQVANPTDGSVSGMKHSGHSKQGDHSGMAH